MQNIFSGHLAVSPVVTRKSVARKLPHYVISALLLAGFAGIPPVFAAPVAPSVPDLATGTDTGLSHTDNITSYRQPQFRGTATPLSLVKVFAERPLGKSLVS